jgi:hypothetical protein
MISNGEKNYKNLLKSNPVLIHSSAPTQILTAEVLATHQNSTIIQIVQFKTTGKENDALN